MMLYHHTKFGYKKLSSSEDITWTEPDTHTHRHGEGGGGWVCSGGGGDGNIIKGIYLLCIVVSMDYQVGGGGGGGVGHRNIIKGVYWLCIVTSIGVPSHG